MAYGALVKAREWETWFRANQGRRLGHRAGWERFLVDAIVMTQAASVRDARRLRGASYLRRDHRGYSDDEVHDPVVVAARDFDWFHRHRAAAERDAPDWARFLFEAVSGVLHSRVRVALETRQAIKRGVVTVNVNPHATRKDPFTGEEEA